MTSPYTQSDMSPKDRAQYGAALAKAAAFDAVYGLWRRRSLEGWTQARVAANIGVDEGWLSKQFVGPRNWTMDSFGTLVVGLEGELDIIARAIEDQAYRANYDAYSQYGIYSERPALTAFVPPEKKNVITGFRNDPLVLFFLKHRLNEPAPVPVS
jgi:hypothetical protein